eukprot:GFUD01001762.1.p1 GENE.GFUD01001762.1~~GFUD01001762.1.p1  ORF type:complete len:1286 (-),score=466.67 GFUD01001762.1:638-4495(-)
MSGVEDVINPPPDDREKSVEKEDLSDTIDGKDEDKASFTASLTDSESTSLTGSTSESWTLLEKEEEEIQKKTVESEVSEVPEVIGSSVEEVEETDQTDVTDPIDQTIKSPVEETDSESIETISDDECFVSHPLANSIHANIASFCYIPDVTDSGFSSSLTSSTSRFPSSLTSTTSTIYVASDGIPIQDIEDIEDRSLGAEDGQPQYEWNNEGEKEIPEEEALSEEIEPAGEISDDEDIQEDEEDREDELEEGSNDESGERRLELSEPGYDLDDDGLPGAPLPPLNQEVELYPSQELDPSFMAIKKGEVYKHDKNLQLDHFLTAILILALALVIGLGIGHFLGLFLSVTTSIHSSLFGLEQDPFEESFGMDPGYGGIESGPGFYPFPDKKRNEPTIDSLTGESVENDEKILPGDHLYPFPDKKTNNPTIDPLTGEPDINHEEMLPGDLFIDDLRSVNDFNIAPEQKDDFNQQLQEPVEQEESFSIFGAIKNVFTRLGTKFGYIKKSPIPDPVVHHGPGTEEYYEFQCMTADDQPIMIDNQPVMVSEPQDCHQYYIKGQAEGHASQLDPPDIYMESARTAFKSDDQDLDDRVIRQLWDENQELRDQVQQMRTNAGDQGDEAMAAILRDRINDLLTANADLEREVARLRYADAARGAAESVETLNKLRKTRDTLNDIVTENDQLKIEVAKARYGEPPAHKSTKAERDRLANENQELKNEMEKMKISNNEYKSKASDKMHEKFENALKYLEELTVEKHTLFNNNLKQDDLNTPWPSRRHEELRNEDEEEEAKVVEEKDDNEDEDNDVDEDDDNEDIKSTSMNNLSKYLSGLVGVGSKILTKQGTIDWVQAKKFVGGLKEDLSTKFEEAGKLAKEDLGIIVNKFDDLKKFVDTEKVKQNMKATKTAAGKLVKSLVGAVKDLKEASEDAAEKSDWIGKFKTEAIKVKSGLETKWYEIKDKWQKVVVKNKHEDEDEDEDDHDDDDEKERSRDNRRNNDDDNDEEEDYKKNEFEEKKQKAERKRYSDADEDDDEGYQSFDERERKGDDEHHNNKNKKRNDKRTNIDEDEDEDEDHRKEKKNFKNKKDDSKNRQYWTKENKTAEAESDNWTVNRAEERDRMRRGEERSDWIFERAKHRKDARHEETRGDWYTERKQRTDSDQQKQQTDSDQQKFSKKQRRERKYNKDEDDKYTEDREFNQNKKSDKKQRGEKYVKSKNKYKTDKKDNRRYRGETDQGDDEDYEYYQFDEEVHYAERHYNDRAGKNRHEKRAKRRFSKRENEKEFVIEADFEQFY